MDSDKMQSALGNESEVLHSNTWTIDELIAACEDNGTSIIQTGAAVLNEDLGERPLSDANKTNGLPKPILNGQEKNNHPFHDDMTHLNSSSSPILSSSDCLKDNNDYPHTRSGNQKKKRKKSIRQENQAKRMKGDEYLGYSKAKDPLTSKGRTPQNMVRRARKIGRACGSKECQNSKKRFCSNFSENDRQVIFHDFWKSLNWEGKRAYVKSLVDQMVPRRCTTKTGPIRKNITFMFHLKLNGVRKQVCRAMFLNTLGMGMKQVRNWLLKSTNRSDRRTSSKGGDSVFAKRFLDDIHKLPSHYCRKDSKKLYLEPIFTTKQQFFEAYLAKCAETSVSPVVRATFMNLVEKKHIAIHQPKKDRCDTCCGWETGNISKEIYQLHIQKKDSARAEKAKDKDDALKCLVHVLTVDMQKVLLSPMLNASALYYKTKLIVHNFTVFDLATSDVMCYLMDETQADLVASVFATCLVKYMNEHFQDNLPVIVYSDGCTAQNRNAVLSNALLHYSVKNNKVVIQKYLEKGHTQMEVDSVHAKIENNLKGRSIYLPTDYVDLCKNARKEQGGYAVTTMTYDQFYDFSLNKVYKSIRPGTRKTDPHVTDIRQFKYNPDGSMEFKLDHLEDWKPFPRRSRVDPKTIFPKLYSERLAISKRKYDDLQDLLHVIPPECHAFYKSLSYK